MCDNTGDHWDDHFLASISQDQAETEEAEDKEMSCMILNHLHQLKLKTYQEAVSAIEDVQTFLDSKGHSLVNWQ